MTEFLIGLLIIVPLMALLYWYRQSRRHEIVRGISAEKPAKTENSLAIQSGGETRIGGDVTAGDKITNGRRNKPT